MSQQTTNRSFDELARALAEGSISRRRALKLFAGTAIAALIPSRALADDDDDCIRICHVPFDRQTGRCFFGQRENRCVPRSRLDEHRNHPCDCLHTRCRNCTRPPTTSTTTTTTTPPPGSECSVGGQTITCPPGQQCCPDRGCFIPGDVVCCQTPAGVRFCPLPEAQCCPEGCIPSDSVCGEPVPCPSAPGGFCPPGALCTISGCVLE